MSMTVEELVAFAAQLRRDIVRMIGPEKVGHLGGSCSLADIVAALYGRVMRLDKTDMAWPLRDRFLLSKGHAALVQYAALCSLGVVPRQELQTLKAIGSRLQGHPDMRKLPGVEANTGSLGQGLSIACGMAAGVRLSGYPSRVYVALGDGELAEGQVWEAAMSAAVYRLDNLCAIVDNNGLQAMGAVAERFDSGPLAPKWRAFGWHVVELDGHDMPSILAAFDEAGCTAGKPTVLIAKTVKGKGIAFAENVVGFHNGAMTRAQYDSVMGGEGA